ncbi:hypothetical protein ANCDUO_10555 [Ancylostoma duodenale]|uniref:Uncharacterized protein n=1 Tax=Ancylostoma duodenale TaxID=51022 RepID=A0A0C2GK34_9BILA|nr:hypothetical protein ANCDUO_10555 [Ancylostoma duodenale]
MESVQEWEKYKEDNKRQGKCRHDKLRVRNRRKEFSMEIAVDLNSIASHGWNPNLDLLYVDVAVS